MPEPHAIPRDEEMLGEIAELEAALAKEAYRRAMAAEEGADFERLARTCKMMGRSMRQSLALRERMLRFRRQEARANPPAPRDEARIARRREALRAAVRRVIFTETETETRDHLWEHLDHCLDDKPQADDWGLEPLADHVMAVCTGFRLSLAQAERWADLPDPPPDFKPAPWADDDDEDEPDYASALHESSG